MVKMKPIRYGTDGPAGPGPIGLSSLKLIASGWRPPLGTLLPHGGVFDSFRRRRLTRRREADAANRVIGSCSFLLASHGDLRLEWGEEDHVEVTKLIRLQMKAGVRFCTLDPASLELVPIKRASRARRREVYVSDPDIKQLIDSGFSRFATTRFGGGGRPDQDAWFRQERGGGRSRPYNRDPAIAGSRGRCSVHGGCDF
jgi:hypothetical protein